jgi:hypothetical protein
MMAQLLILAGEAEVEAGHRWTAMAVEAVVHCLKVRVEAGADRRLTEVEEGGAAGC